MSDTTSPAAASSPDDEVDANEYSMASPDDNDATPQTNPVVGEVEAISDDDPTLTASSNCIDINIVYDDYPAETSWKLYKVDTYEDIEIESHQGLEGDPPFTETICLEDGEYKFVISDSFGDGITSPGLYTVTSSDGVAVAEGGGFDESESTNFLLPYIPYPSMTPSSSPHPTMTSSPTISPSSSLTQGPQCEGSNPDACGCASVRQNDYRGTISTTASGKECKVWDPYVIENFPDAGLEDNNYCRNPIPGNDRAWCYTDNTDGDDDWGYSYEECDVPICEDSLPSAYPSSSLHPTISPKPTTSQASTPYPKCHGSNPEVCGCASVNQADYRGTINMASSGNECIRWDDENNSIKPEDYPDAGLEDNNYCRNPEQYYKDSAWCYTTDGSEDCDVPICPECEGSNPGVCGCANVGQADYRGTISRTTSGKGCIRWDDDSNYSSESYSGAGLEDNNYCRNPNPNDDDISGGAWCLSELDGSMEDCDVPYCFPPALSCPSVSTISMNEELQTACSYHQCVTGSEYELDDYITPNRAEVKPDCLCAFEVWDCEFDKGVHNRES